MAKSRPPSPKPKSNQSLWWLLAVVLIPVAGAVLFFRSRTEPVPVSSSDSVAVTRPLSAEPPVQAPLPVPGVAQSDPNFVAADLPLLPMVPYPSARPRDAVRAAYEFAARHPEVLEYIPCFCGCGHEGHKSNENCFVKSRGPGNAIVWDEHGVGCGVCLDVGRDAMRMYASGASVSEIRAVIDRQYAANQQSRTPTPLPPK